MILLIKFNISPFHLMY